VAVLRERGMRSLSIGAMVAALTFAVSPVSAQAQHPLRTAGLTIVTDFQGPHNDRSVAEMKHELEGILKQSGLALDWRTRGDAGAAVYPDMVLVRFKGKCVMEPVGYLYDERGPLAFTYRADGAVLPFSEVACDKVTSSIRSAMWGGDFGRGDVLLGRALGRVVAHEVVHILSHSAEHGHDGVARESLSGSQLIASELPLSPADVERIFSRADTGHK
jgi:hypothetical protein